MQIQAKPTAYNGYLFRSKLEAKWAVFFDALRIPYVYEPEATAFGMSAKCFCNSKNLCIFTTPKGAARLVNG